MALTKMNHVAFQGATKMHENAEELGGEARGAALRNAADVCFLFSEKTQ